MNAPRRPTSSERVRSALDHPVIDADGHYVESFPALARYLGREGVDDARAPFTRLSAGMGSWGDATPAQRLRRRATVQPWWAMPAANTLDLATALLPRLLHERLDQLGLDFAVMYSSAGLVYAHVQDEHTRRKACRALNRYSADAFADCADRLTPAAVIPMHSPAEAIEELEFATGELGLRAAMIAGFVERPIEEPVEGAPHRVWWDTYGLDSAHDYDPLWRRALELGVSLASHSGSMGIGFRRSPTTYMHNHIGHFGAVGEALAKSLFFGGVTRRFPRLRIGLLEGGVHWGVGLYADLIARWKKRNARAVRLYDPERIDRALLAELMAKYGPELGGESSERIVVGDSGSAHDDFAALGLESAEQIRELFVPNFYFGCEADDPMTPTAFDRDRIPGGVCINAMFSSDIGHWDVPEMTEVLEEAHENVEHGWLDAAGFRAFVFGNVARFYTDTNPDFFRGTRVERAVAEELRR